ncbi:MAG: hypothetical protein WA821_16725 [Anaerolineales bacterium]
MKTQLAITDLTRMRRGCVCVAGYDKDGCCIRPILPPPGIDEKYLFEGCQPIVFPFALVEYNLVRPRPQPPHSEDYVYNPYSVQFIRRVEDDKRERLLNNSLFENVEAIFEQTVHGDQGNYVMDGCGPRSIGTILPKDILEVKYEQDVNGNWNYRLRFIDNQKRTYRIKITDLTWHYYCDSLRGENHSPSQIASELSKMLRSRKVYLRIGLARGWAEHPERCYLQVNAIHTFPDYLNGKTFADFRPVK